MRRFLQRFLVAPIQVWINLLAASALLSIPGCLYIPNLNVEESRPVEGIRVTQEEVVTFEIGRTSRDEVRSRIGDPDLIWVNENIEAWRWTDRLGIFIFVVGHPYGGIIGGLPLTKEKVLLMQFDDQDRLSKIDLEQLRMDLSVGEQLRSFRDQEGPQG